jgi:predicted DNA-binding ribbon-helix-helix protein
MDQFAEKPGAGPQFRVLQHEGKKHALRMESVFWLQIEECAQSLNTRAASLISEIVSRCEEEANRTSAVRVYCINWLRERLKGLETKKLTLDLTPMLSACPTPAFLLASTGRLVMYNRSFSNTYLDSEDATPIEDANTRVWHLFGHTIRESRAVLTANPDRVVSGRVRLRGAGTFEERNVSATLVDRSSVDTSPILVFIQD